MAPLAVSESAAQLGNQFARRVDDELFIFLTDMALSRSSPLNITAGIRISLKVCSRPFSSQ